MTYEEIMLDVSKRMKSKVVDYSFAIPNGIVLWLKDGSMVVYIPKSHKATHKNATTKP